ncbi:lipid-A-disaccharide synthase [Tuwongella immobilis]|uniref:Lipid-A-disaccharide synthase n=1 Tax=Tuwongella immobilis TaxID=692036 RepID=A0A6C2YQ98_9BACT|nr:lipid-A-disaccharide synthase [Tuwongella immobilis]VIP03491.1 lipid-a-disaccharide synthase : Lipid-A-disaccharide synthase OS=Singulisphaera acidiphila (strain ATCC BAA-1392 / DSM 18658 / VKM B-2454 / MOB10) GN=Sinac_5294 PE=4 SV=1: LpxB [Tuwongella immobilis]VTS04351.1 lipid-a-disaccharide synthase : Lipid-A-disaccharide synthase OS=Singulisphaera acidiphila (strain ATCC BAA-1392 / DSM 18658 / VKM B-2454 / MOB10) GN=Sinac_5294 PE=4 SV=1: LpxB [Tuwongella immobilis]
MHLFISAGEPSGDLHGSNLIHALRQRVPNIRFTGLGGEKMEAAGCPLLDPMANHSVMGYKAVLQNLSYFISLVGRARCEIRKTRPDAVVVIDYPGFHFGLAKRVKPLNIPVFWFVAPQLWAWANWRVRKMQRWVDMVLTTLPFEETWFRDRGVNAKWVGHPYFDELRHQPRDTMFLQSQRQIAGPLIAILPGSRRREVERNLPMQLRAAAKIHASRPDVRFAVASFNDVQAGIAREMVQQQNAIRPIPVEVFQGRTPELIETATACISVSGSVSLELMHALKPAVIHYHISWIDQKIMERALTVPYITLVNLLENQRVYPEYLGNEDRSSEIAEHILGWLNSPSELAAKIAQLQSIRDRVAIPGACSNAADAILERIAELQSNRSRRAAS